MSAGPADTDSRGGHEAVNESDESDVTQESPEKEDCVDHEPGPSSDRDEKLTPAIDIDSTEVTAEEAQDKPASADPTEEAQDEPASADAKDVDVEQTEPAAVPDYRSSVPAGPSPIVAELQAEVSAPALVAQPSESLSLPEFAAAALNVVLDPGPSAPDESPLLLGVLAFARREAQRSLVDNSLDGGARIATTSALIAPPNTAPVAVKDGPFIVAKNGSITLTYAQLLGNDIDPDTGDTRIITSVAATTGTVVHNAVAKTVTYTAPADYTGAATFYYRIKDAAGAVDPNAAKVTLNVSRPNTAPVAVKDGPARGCPATLRNLSDGARSHRMASGFARELSLPPQFTDLIRFY